MASFRFTVTVKADSRDEAEEILRGCIEGVAHPIDQSTITIEPVED